MKKLTKKEIIKETASWFNFYNQEMVDRHKKGLYESAGAYMDKCLAVYQVLNAIGYFKTETESDEIISKVCNWEAVEL